MFIACYNTVVLKKKIGKTVKNCSFEIILWQKTGHWASMSHTQNQAQFFFVEITKGDKLSRTFYFIRISYVLAES